jgi:arylsulfatase
LGDRNGGWALYFLDGRPVTCVISFGYTTRLAAPNPLGPGVKSVAVRYRPGQAGSNLAVLVDGEEVAVGDHPGVLVFPALSTVGAGMLVGRHRGLPFNDDYEPPFPLSTTLRSLVIRSDAPGATRTADDVIQTAAGAD